MSTTAVSLSVSFAGLFLLFAVLLFAEPQEAGISELQELESRDVRIRGTVTGVREFERMAILEVAEIRSVDVVVFGGRELPEAGRNVTITGELRDYEGKKQVIAEGIR